MIRWLKRAWVLVHIRDPSSTLPLAFRDPAHFLSPVFLHTFQAVQSWLGRYPQCRTVSQRALTRNCGAGPWLAMLSEWGTRIMQGLVPYCLL